MEVLTDTAAPRGAADPVVPLTLVGEGAMARVAAVSGGGAAARRLATLGFVEGAPVRVCGRAATGWVVEVRGVRLALDRATAARVLCREGGGLR